MFSQDVGMNCRIRDLIQRTSRKLSVPDICRITNNYFSIGARLYL
jgi:hypothetical protein